MSQDGETTPNLLFEFPPTYTVKSPGGRWRLDFPWENPPDNTSEKQLSWSDGSWFVSVYVAHYPQK